MGASKGKRTASGGEGTMGRTAKTDQREIDQHVFLAAFATCGSITTASATLREAQGKELTPKGRQAARDIHYRWLREDGTYKERFEEAREEFAGLVEEELIRRAMEGDDEYVVSAGKLVYFGDEPLTQRRRSDRLLEVLAKAHLPERYADRQKIEHSGEVRTIQGLLSDLPPGGES